jgi:PIN domain nuclease of toxin-antitoxin system
MERPPVIVLDTHAWVWWVAQTGRIPARAGRLIDQAREARTLFVSSISAWEVAMLTARNRLTLTMPVRDWVAHSEALPFLQFLPVTNAIAMAAVELPRPETPTDPADRIIIATALSLGARVVTRDKQITSCRVVATVW